MLHHSSITPPCERTIRNLLNRLGYRLRRVQKTKPLKKIKETEAIFAQVEQVHERAAGSEDTLRISIDTKAKVQVGKYSRDGAARGEEAVKALDHDMEPEATLVPFGILEVVRGLLTILFGTTRLTSDFVVDCLERWWQERRRDLPRVKRLVIDLDNGPETSSRRTQFVRRLVEFADRFGLVIELVYYPPYHSKYNPIERCWGILAETLPKWSVVITPGACYPVVSPKSSTTSPPARSVLVPQVPPDGSRGPGISVADVAHHPNRQPITSLNPPLMPRPPPPPATPTGAAGFPARTVEATAPRPARSVAPSSGSRAAGTTSPRTPRRPAGTAAGAAGSSSPTGPGSSARSGCGSTPGTLPTPTA